MLAGFGFGAGMLTRAAIMRSIERDVSSLSSFLSSAIVCSGLWLPPACAKPANRPALGRPVRPHNSGVMARLEMRSYRPGTQPA